ncbi:MAG: acetylxylan esterase [Bacteroidales bacterium]|jgi:cephalosporin-C deacetylase-like acetyl esterase|nr:acetylxylan esterase [Bacteroidales bacterium]
MKRLFTALSILLALSGTVVAQSIVPAEWKFLPGDKQEYIDSALNEYWWNDISPLTGWEKQGFEGYDGYAWYRVKVVVPASMKRNAIKYGGLMLNLGKIDDADETWFNGHLVGRTGKMPPGYIGAYNVPRSYLIPPEYIRWGGKNTIAVRVYDAGGDGGLWGGPVELTNRGNPDLLTLGTAFDEEDMILTGSPGAEIPVTIRSEFRKKYRGALSIKIVTDFGEEFHQGYREVAVKKNSTATFTFRVTGLRPGFYRAALSLESKMGNKKHTFNFGYEPEKIASPADPQPDFMEFWQRAKAELATVDPQYKLIRIDSLCTETHNVYLVEMRSLGNALIRGWYQVPAKPGRYPAIMQVPGYSSVELPSYINYGDDVIGFGLNIRGHGNSKDDINPGFPGYILTNLADKEKYIYRGAYMDCVRGIDFLSSRPEVDASRIAVEGSSQGGALTFATAALASDRIAVCAPQVPFLSDFRDYFRVAAWPANEFIDLVENRKALTWEHAYYTLSYFDIKNLAPMIKAPLIMGVGLLDDVCPPHINFAAYNLVTSEKKYIAYPRAGHGLPEHFWHAKMGWIREHLGLK